MTIKRYDPQDIIITPDYRITFWNNIDKTVEELQRAFPCETEIAPFFKFMSNPGPADMASMRKITFKDLLDKHFSDNRLKAILSIVLLGNGGLPPSLMSAFIGSKIFTEFIIDGGYYPQGGMQILPDMLTQRFEELGGELRPSCLIRKVQTEEERVVGVITTEGSYIPSRYVISNCDARQTFFKLLGKRLVTRDFLDKLQNMVPSLSMFVIYLGLNRQMDTLATGCTIWFLPHYDIEDIYRSAKKRNVNNLAEFLLHVSPDRKSLVGMATASFRCRSFWTKHKHRFMDTFVDLIERSVIPDLSKYVVYRDAATPDTLHRYTLNYRGAAYGWESTSSQLADPDFKRPSFLQNFYLTGHWTTQGMGVAGSAYTGYSTANSLIKRERVKVR
jgi:prolycopene isomerase